MEELYRVNKRKTLTHVDALPGEIVDRQHYRARFWLLNYFTAFARVYIDCCEPWIALVEFGVDLVRFSYIVIY